MVDLTEFLCSEASSILGILQKYLLDHLCYIIQVQYNVNTLTGKKAPILERKHDTVKQRVQFEERGGRKKATCEVQGWLERVEAILQRSQEIERAYNNRSCMLGTCSINCLSNHSISKRASEELQNVEEELKFIGEINDYTSEMVPPSVQEMPITTTTPGGQLAMKMQEALNFVREDVHGVLGIWGMGGVGKTTLLEHINNSLLADSFIVIYVVASRECTIEKIQGLVAKKLGLEEKVDYFKWIFEFLKDKNFVLLLDDVWEPLDLTQVGIPHPLGVANKQKRKVIMTTRFLHVCNNMGASRKINVECLVWEAAWALFLENVGEELVKSNRQIEEIAKKAARECDGLPLALITIGRAMSGNPSIQVWENVVELLRKSRLSKIPGMDSTKDPLSILKISYDYLKDSKVQECFLHCALWPEDYRIRKEELIECWLGHGLIDEFDDIREAYNEGHMIIDILQKVCLLQYTESNYLEFRSEDPCVKMHDLVRDMALWVAHECGANEKKWVVLVGVGLEEAPQDENTWNAAHKISLMENHITKLPPRITNCPNLTTLVLRRNAYFSLGHASSIKYFSALKYLDMSECFSVNRFPLEVCRLHNLEYLNLSYTKIYPLPEELKDLINLKYLHLVNTGISMIPNGILPNLVSLLFLDISSLEYRQTSVINQLECLVGHLKGLGITATSVWDLEKLSKLGIPIRSLVIRKMTGLISLCLTSNSVMGRHHMCSNIKNLIIRDSDLEKLIFEGKSLPMSCDFLYLSNLSGLKDILWKGVEPGFLFPKLHKVDIDDCSELKHATWLAHLPCLEILSLYHCTKMESLIHDEGAESTEIDTPLFPSLRALHFTDLPEFATICEGALAFPFLEILTVELCPQLKTLPFSSPTSCSKVKRITGEQEWWERLELDDTVRASLPYKVGVITSRRPFSIELWDR